MKSLLVALTLFCALLAGTAWAEPVPDGFYAVVRREAGPDAQTPLAEGELRLRFHEAFADTQETIVVRRADFVPLQLREPPTKTPDPTERTRFWVRVSLSDEAAAQFESFTERHLGQSVAIVVGGDVITVHGIRAVIQGGKVQISRCGDDGCQILFRELTQ